MYTAPVNERRSRGNSELAGEILGTIQARRRLLAVQAAPKGFQIRHTSCFGVDGPVHHLTPLGRRIRQPVGHFAELVLLFSTNGRPRGRFCMAVNRKR